MVWHPNNPSGYELPKLKCLIQVCKCLGKERSHTHIQRVIFLPNIIKGNMHINKFSKKKFQTFAYMSDP